MTAIRIARPCIAMLAALGGSLRAADSDPVDRIEWAQFLARHDLVWGAPPARWDEGAFTGNGRLGAMVYARTNGNLCLDVGRSDVVDRGNRIAIGFFEMATAGRPRSAALRLDLWNAEVRGEWSTDRGRLALRTYTHAIEPVQVVEWRSDGESPDFAFRHESSDDARKLARGEPIADADRNPAPQMDEINGVRVCRQPFRAGGGYALAWAARAEDGGGRLIWSVRPGLDAAGAAGDVLRAIETGPVEMERTHRAWWHRWWPASFLSIPDTRLESFYWIQMYKLGSAARPDGPAIDLMGPWFRSTPWPRIWWNLNLQLTYWPVYTANRLDVGESLVRMLRDGASNLVENAPAPMRSDSAAIGRTSSYDCRGAGGSELGNLTWALHNVWLHWRHGGDDVMRREFLYPMLRRAAMFMIHHLRTGDDGRLHFPPDVSPEYPQRAPDTNYNLALLRWAIQTLLAVHERDGLNDPDAPRWRDVAGRLPPFPADATGLMIGDGVPLAVSHRHFSHLLMFYPLHLLDPDSPADRPLLERSLDHWIGFEGALQGYSFTGAAAMSAWLGRREAAADLLNRFVDRYVRPNTMYLEAGPVIETPLSGAASIQEMLLQSWTMDPLGVCIRVFPSLPDAWLDAVVHNLSAEGGFLVSAVRRGGTTRWIRIHSKAGAPCRVRTGFPGAAAARGARTFAVHEAADVHGRSLTVVDLRKGESVVLYPAGSPPRPDEFAIAPVASQSDRENWFGSRKAPWVRAGADNALTLTSDAAALRGTALIRETKAPAGNIGRWIEPADEIVWKVQAPRAGVWEISLRHAGPRPAALRLRIVRAETGAKVEPMDLRIAVPATGGYDAFQTTPAGPVHLPEVGGYEFILGSGDGRAPAINLEHIRLAPIAVP